MFLDIKKMTLKDFNEISNILISDFDNFWTSNCLKNELNCTNSYFLVARENNKIIGFAGLKKILDEADIMNIVVRKDSRSQGIGSKLLENLIIYAKDTNLKTLNLEVNENNFSAIHLYYKFGFNYVGIRKNYYNNNSAIIMSKQLFN